MDDGMSLYVVLSTTFTSNGLVLLGHCVLPCVFGWIVFNDLFALRRGGHGPSAYDPLRFFQVQAKICLIYLIHCLEYSIRRRLAVYGRGYWGCSCQLDTHTV